MPDILPDRPLSSLFTELTRETADLFRSEIRLAKAEIGDKARQAGRGAAEIAAGGLILFVALQALAATAILALIAVVEPWLAALIVTVVLALIGAVVLSKGLHNVKSDSLAPKKTMDSLRDNTRWAKEQMR